jgi:hypothetical protein
MKRLYLKKWMIGEIRNKTITDIQPSFIHALYLIFIYREEVDPEKPELLDFQILTKTYSLYFEKTRYSAKEKWKLAAFIYRANRKEGEFWDFVVSYGGDEGSGISIYDRRKKNI